MGNCTRIKRPFAIAFLGMTLLCAIGCDFGPSTGTLIMQTTYSVTPFVGGPEVTFNVDRSAEMAQEGSNVIFITPEHRITVTRSQILLDGQQQYALPAKAQRVVVNFTADKLTASADGTPLKRISQASPNP